MSKVAAYVMRSNGLAKRVVPMLAAGAERVGDQVVFYGDDEFRPDHVEMYDAAIFWGYVLTLQAIMAGYNEAGKAAVYLDLAYWKRDVCYKVSVGARHPTAYFQRFTHNSSRRELFGIEPKPYREQGPDAPVLIAGLSAKGAWAEKEGLWGDYEKDVVATLLCHTQRPIIYRAKTRGEATPIAGTRLSTLAEPLGPLLKRSWAVVTRHSNVAVDGLVEGIPAFAQHGVASVMALKDFSKIESPWRPERREQWLNDVAYCQWSEDELKDGTCWRHLKSEGLVR